MTKTDIRQALLLLLAGEGSDKTAAALGVTAIELEQALLNLVPEPRERPLAQKSPDSAGALTEEPVVHVDAGSRGNPGPSAYAFVISSLTRQETCGGFIGFATNNEAEYRGLLEALKWLDENHLRGAKVFMDSTLVVNQVNGKWKIKEPRLMPLAREAVRLKNAVGAEISAVRREKNTLADNEVNRILDEQVSLCNIATP